MNTSRRLPRLSATGYAALRPDPGGVLTEANVHNARLHLVPGCTMRISIYGMSGYSSSAPGVLGRILVDGGARDVEIQASAHPSLIQDFKDAIQDAMEDYLRVMAEAER